MTQSLSEFIQWYRENEKISKGPWVANSSIVKTSINAPTKHIAMVNWYKGFDASRNVHDEEHEANVEAINKKWFSPFGVFKSKHDAQTALRKIKKFVKEEL